VQERERRGTYERSAEHAGAREARELPRTSPSLVLFAKEPVPGRAKTRLVPPLRANEAAALAGAALRDLARRLDTLGGHRVLAMPPEVPDATRRRWTPSGWEAADQGPGDLGARLARATSREFARGRRPVAVLGSDHPDLPLEAVRAALAAAAAGRVGWITTTDGGFACLALPEARPELFAGIPWSSPEVAPATRAAAGRLGFAMEDFGPWYDLDGAADVDRFLRDARNARECPATWTVLAGLEPPWDARRRGHD